ncbi:MAG TPA: zinc dependent phospholipase C family protein [Anaerolineales bacterium]|nr:zinc dependent phospholipase C family protein [Anaerolineales bacterium]
MQGCDERNPAIVPIASPDYTRLPAMPTPFYHLNLICDLCEMSGFPRLLRDEWPAFCFGNIAPDAQTLTQQARAATHFFEVPMRDLTPAWREMFRQYPALARPAQMPPAQAAFLAGYLCHLGLDQLWIARIFEPVFGPEAGWETFSQRLFLHNTLRIHLDRLDVPKLRAGMGHTLQQAAPSGWLPFLADDDLRRWRDFVADQLIDGAISQTVEVFAARMSLAPTEFESLLQSPTAMQAQIFDRLPLEQLAVFREQGLADSRAVLAEYLTAPEA